MKQNSKSLLVLLTLSLLLSCARTPQQPVSKKPEALTVDVTSEKLKGSIVRVVGWLGTKIHIGSGFFVARDKIATNIHVVAHPGPVFAKLDHEETVWSVEGVTVFDVKNDLVILKIAGEGTPLLLGDSDAVRSGGPISAIGFPDGVYKVMHGTVFNVRNSDKRIQTTANTVSGNSGGPLLNSRGQVIGVHAGRDEAIPSNALKALLTQSAPVEPLAQWHKRKLIRAYAHFVLGTTKFTAKNYDEGMIHFDKAIQMSPKFIYAYYARGAAKSVLGDYNGAIADYDKYIELNSGDAAAYRERGSVKFKLGDTEAERGNTEKARSLYKATIEDYTYAIKLNPNKHHAYDYPAWRKYLFGQFEAAAGNMVEARRLYQAAIVDSDKSIQQDPNNVSAYYTRGAAKVALGDAKGAIDDFDELVRMSPEYAEAYYKRGQAKEALGQMEAAKADFQKAKELDPDVGQ